MPPRRPCSQCIFFDPEKENICSLLLLHRRFLPKDPAPLSETVFRATAPDRVSFSIPLSQAVEPEENRVGANHAYNEPERRTDRICAAVYPRKAEQAALPEHGLQSLRPVCVIDKGEHGKNRHINGQQVV